MKGDPEWTHEERDEICQGITECEIKIEEVKDNMDEFNKYKELKGSMRKLKEAVENLQDTIDEYW